MTTGGNAIPFLSQEGEIVNITSSLVQQSDFLAMLVSRAQTHPIKTTVLSHDLKLTEAICYWDCLPCLYQNTLRPHGFDTWQLLVDFMGISPSLTDDGNCYINSFLSYMGLDGVTEEPTDPYDGWSEMELDALKQIEAREEQEWLAETSSDS
jgi:hypothetical protein